MTRRSLLDAVDVAVLRAAAAARSGPFAAAVAGLVDLGVLQHDRADPGWADRDRLVVGGPRPDAALRPGDPAVVLAPGVALGRAVAEAAASAAAGGIYRVWCLLDVAAADDGATWAAARGAVAAGSAELAVVCRAGTLADLLRLAGWQLLPAVGADALSVLGGIDRALAHRGGPAVVALT